MSVTLVLLGTLVWRKEKKSWFGNKMGKQAAVGRELWFYGAVACAALRLRGAAPGRKVVVDVPFDWSGWAGRLGQVGSFVFASSVVSETLAFVYH